MNRFLAGLLAVGFVLLLIAAGAALWFQLRAQEYSDWVEHTRQTETIIGDFSAQLERVETARRGYLVTGDDSFRRIFVDTADDMPRRLQDIVEQTVDNPEQQARAAEIKQLLTEQQQYQLRSVELVANGRRSAAIEGFRMDPSVLLTRRIRAAAQDMRGAERDLLRYRDYEQGRSLQVFYAVLATTGALLILVTVATFVVMRRFVNRLTESQEELRRLNLDLEGAVQERTVDLSRANEEIQRFAYIVSHDLRSPLVNVMGFTAELDAARKPVEELLDRVGEANPDLLTSDAEDAVRHDLPEAIAFIRTSTQKMDRLINAILRLSREGRRSLTAEPLDMDAVAQGIVDSLHQRIADAGAEVVVEEPLPDIVHDRVAIEQIFSNLIENAIKYLQPGRPGHVVIRGAREHDRIVYEVEDNGRGVDPKDHERIFDLFRRSGTQDQPGEGIGLAHVRALAYRLGGIIDIRSELDRGATFRLSLPAHYEAGIGS